MPPGIGEKWQVEDRNLRTETGGARKRTGSEGLWNGIVGTGSGWL